jgi:5-methylcytosine-specific restriction endonuclease McrA
MKKEMFELNQTCKICGQKISMIDDAVLDHDVRYWSGGKTVPENAQLVHRHCNTNPRRV